jgi:hypothetical protein
VFGVIASNNHFEHHVHSVLVEPGTPIRLRVYNIASGTNFFLNITSEEINVESHVVAIDGHWIAPVDLSSLEGPLWVGIGQRYDILIFVPNRRWTRIMVTAIEEGDTFGRQIGSIQNAGLRIGSNLNLCFRDDFGDREIYVRFITRRCEAIRSI